MALSALAGYLVIGAPAGWSASRKSQAIQTGTARPPLCGVGHSSGVAFVVSVSRAPAGQLGDRELAAVGRRIRWSPRTGKRSTLLGEFHQLLNIAPQTGLMLSY